LLYNYLCSDETVAVSQNVITVTNVKPKKNWLQDNFLLDLRSNTQKLGSVVTLLNANLHSMTYSYQLLYEYSRNKQTIFSTRKMGHIFIKTNKNLFSKH